MNMKYLKSFLESNSEILEVDSEDIDLIKRLFTDIEDEFDLYESNQQYLLPNTFKIRILYFTYTDITIKTRKEIRVEARVDSTIMNNEEVKSRLKDKWNEFLENAFSNGYKLGSPYQTEWSEETGKIKPFAEPYFGCNLIYK